ncbi:hypothetical protein MJO28_004369 [Puccinia striiformis f. sp. tritici]|uniref:Uncharacterized protein n=1 Tax=Puccinia striiformis f. sp. tritici TaxID=168172 RepID=A0ACC0ENR3_9BASI|nr:hypothetical protein MJO28_004369 [Puccinia striiformis f. sp. tritici]
MNLATCLLIILTSTKVADANDEFSNFTIEQLLELFCTQRSASDSSNNTIQFSKADDYPGLWGSQAPYIAHSIRMFSARKTTQPTISHHTGRSIDSPLCHWDKQPTSTVSPGKLVTNNSLQGIIATSKSDIVNAESTGQLVDLWGESSPEFINNIMDFEKLDAELGSQNRSLASLSPEAPLDYQCFFSDPVISAEASSITSLIVPQKIQADSHSDMGVKTQWPQYQSLTHTYPEANELVWFFTSSAEQNGNRSPKRRKADFLASPPLLQSPHEHKERSLKDNERPHNSTFKSSVKISERRTGRKIRAKLLDSIHVWPQDIIITGQNGAQSSHRKTEANTISSLPEIQAFIDDSDVWYGYWKTQTNTNFRTYNRRKHVDEKSYLPDIFLPFLIFVEMMLTTIFGSTKNETLDYT